MLTMRFSVPSGVLEIFAKKEMSSDPTGQKGPTIDIPMDFIFTSSDEQ